MADAEGSLPPSKKRVAGREMSRDNPGLDDDDEQEGEVGTFKRASEEVLATRRIVKVRRQQSRPTSTSNPFAGLQLVTPGKSQEEIPGHPDSADKAPMEEHACQENNASDGNKGVGSAVNADDADKSNEIAAEDNGEVVGGRTEEVPVQLENDKEAVEVIKGKESGREETERRSERAEDDSKKETGAEKAEDYEGDESKEEATKEVDNKQEDQKNSTAEVPDSFSSFQQLSSRQNAFTGLAGTGFSTSSFSFGLISKGSAGAGSGSLFGLGSENLLHTSIGIGVANNGGSLQLFRSTSLEATSVGGASKPVMPEVSVETGEENENAVFTADAILFEYLDGGWKERGKGEVKVNVATSGSEKARLVMRSRGNYRLILNANLYPDMCLKGMEKRGVTFACINSATEGRDGFTTFALKFKEASVVGDFHYAVDTYKGKKAEAPVISSGDSV